jgi:3-hydroxyisobutyrate dehydrogenase-like beta-hydroxyacid dehydrogenase
VGDRVTTVGVLHPGAMGEALGGALAGAGARVVWASDGRSAATKSRAERSGFEDVGMLAALTDSDVVVSICPPECARDVAESVAALGFGGVYLDANAIAPATAEAIDSVVRGSGASYVDGGVIGGPDAPRLFLSGVAASDLVSLFGAPVTAVALDGPAYAASSLKMIYAGWTKGTSARLFTLAAAAKALGVGDAVADEWARSQPALGPRLQHAGPSAAKAWRWSGEMHEIAAALASVDLPSEFHECAADVFNRLSALKDDQSSTIDDVLERLLTSKTASSSSSGTQIGEENR